MVKFIRIYGHLKTKNGEIQCKDLKFLTLRSDFVRFLHYTCYVMEIENPRPIYICTNSRDNCNQLVVAVVIRGERKRWFEG